MTVVLAACLTLSPLARPVPVASPDVGARMAIAPVWIDLAECESNRTWDYRGLHNGGLQFRPSTWDAFRVDEPERAYLASPRQEVAVARRVLAVQGVKAWPNCGPLVGLTREDAR